MLCSEVAVAEDRVAAGSGRADGGGEKACNRRRWTDEELMIEEVLEGALGRPSCEAWRLFASRTGVTSSGIVVRIVGSGWVRGVRGLDGEGRESEEMVVIHIVLSRPANATRLDRPEEGSGHEVTCVGRIGRPEDVL